MAQKKLTFYEGAYTVELQPGAPKNHIGGRCTVRGNTVSVPQGSVQQVMGGIQFYVYSAEGQRTPFSWGYHLIRRICDTKGETLWENWDVQEERARR